MEHWKIIDGFPHYEVSDMGNVRSYYNRYKHNTGKIVIDKTPKMMSNGNCKGYQMLVLKDKDGVRRNCYVHRLVASAFIPNPYNKPDVNHIDGNPSNNKVTNLEWVTESENLKHALYVTKTATVPSHCKKVRCIETGQIFDSTTDARDWAKLSKKNRSIEKCCRKEKYHYTAGGYHWEYL